MHLTESSSIRLVDHLVGLKEIADMLGVTSARSHQLAASDGFPAPLGEISAGRIWRREDIEAWARATGRTIAPAGSLHGSE